MKKRIILNEKRIENMQKKTAKKTEFWLRGKNSEMKFRVWSNILHQFVDITHPFEMDLAYKNGIWFMGDEARVIQPYIGCKDIDGLEIYEGDIVETDENGWIAVVVFGNGMFCCEDAGGGFSSYVNWSACQVIGNVYENPELVAKMKKDAKAYKELAKALKEEKKK